jgi:hypothetical protein
MTAHADGSAGSSVARLLRLSQVDNILQHQHSRLQFGGVDITLK